MPCSVAQCLEVVGEWWTLLILRDAFLGVSRFDHFQERLGISRNVLTQRLTRLTDAGVMRKTAYSEHPPRFDYKLTEKGHDLWPVITTMRQWGDQHAAPDGPPVEVIHTACGVSSVTILTCSTCGEPVTWKDVRVSDHPGVAVDLGEITTLEDR